MLGVANHAVEEPADLERELLVLRVPLSAVRPTGEEGELAGGRPSGLYRRLWPEEPPRRPAPTVAVAGRSPRIVAMALRSSASWQVGQPPAP